jgi:hypothetical protein
MIRANLCAVAVIAFGAPSRPRRASPARGHERGPALRRRDGRDECEQGRGGCRQVGPCGRAGAVLRCARRAQP